MLGLGFFLGLQINNIIDINDMVGLIYGIILLIISMYSIINYYK